MKNPALRRGGQTNVRKGAALTINALTGKFSDPKERMKN